MKPSQVRFYTRELGATLEIEKAIAKLRSIVTPLRWAIVSTYKCTKTAVLEGA